MESRLSSAKKQIEQARGRVVAANSALDSSAAQMDQATKALEALGFDSTTQAEARVAELHAEAEVLLTQIEQSLEEAE